MNEYINRCFDLANLGRGSVSPNPLVGAVIVYQGRIIGEGYHRKYGEAHAEVNAVNSVREADQKYLPHSTLYINLEPCCIFGNTPPCTDLIIKNKIPNVVFASIDSTAGVMGKSIDILEEAGVSVQYGLLKEKGDYLVRPRTVFTKYKRPYIILKFAQSEDGFMGKVNENVWLTNPFSKRLVHKWRSEIDAIMVGTNTARIDNPQLDNRLFYGKSPLRIVLDRLGNLPKDLSLFDGKQETWIITEKEDLTFSHQNVHSKKMSFDDSLLSNITSDLHSQKKSILMVEGGAQLLHAFIAQGLWDEARIFTTPKSLLEGIKAPKLGIAASRRLRLDSDQLEIFFNP